jgi:hypothetical protein
MHGQWVGRYSGTNSGQVTVDLDDSGSSYRGIAQLFDDNQALPLSVAVFESIPKTGSFVREVSITHLDRATTNVLNRSQLQQTYPDFVFPDAATVTWDWSKTGIRASWVTSVQSHGTLSLRHGKAEKKSEYRPVKGVTTWKKFKDFVSDLERDRYIFRGQPSPARLRTSFHRSTRSDLGIYVAQDIPTLQRHLNSSGSHVFDFTRPGEAGALYSLAQHHGYPPRSSIGQGRHI